MGSFPPSSRKTPGQALSGIAMTKQPLFTDKVLLVRCCTRYRMLLIVNPDSTPPSYDVSLRLETYEAEVQRGCVTYSSSQSLEVLELCFKHLWSESKICGLSPITPSTTKNKQANKQTNNQRTTESCLSLTWIHMGTRVCCSSGMTILRRAVVYPPSWALPGVPGATGDLEGLRSQGVTIARQNSSRLLYYIISVACVCVVVGWSVCTFWWFGKFVICLNFFWCFIDNFAFLFI